VADNGSGRTQHGRHTARFAVRGIGMPRDLLNLSRQSRVVAVEGGAPAAKSLTFAAPRCIQYSSRSSRHPYWPQGGSCEDGFRSSAQCNDGCFVGLVAPAPTRFVTSGGDKASVGKKLPGALARSSPCGDLLSRAASLLEEAPGVRAQDWLEHATREPTSRSRHSRGRTQTTGTASSAVCQGGGAWTPLGPTYAKGPFQYLSRSVGVQLGDGQLSRAFDRRCHRSELRGGRLPPLARERGRRRLADQRRASRRSRSGRTCPTPSSTIMSPRSRSIPTICRRTPSGRARASPMPAAAAARPVSGSTRRRTAALLERPDRHRRVRGSRVGSIAVQPGNSNVIFAASGRAVLGVSSTCCGGVDALIPGAPHFGCTGR